MDSLVVYLFLVVFVGAVGSGYVFLWCFAGVLDVLSVFLPLVGVCGCFFVSLVLFEWFCVYAWLGLVWLFGWLLGWLLVWVFGCLVGWLGIVSLVLFFVLLDCLVGLVCVVGWLVG